MKGRKVAISPSEHPAPALALGQGCQVTRELGKAMDATSKEMAVPRFEECRYVHDILWISCRDEVAIEWLRAPVEDLRPWEGATFQLMERECLPRLWQMATAVSDSRKRRKSSCSGSADRILASAPSYGG